MNLNLFDWLRSWKILIIVNLFWMAVVTAQEKSSDEALLKTLFATLGSESWAERESAFQSLLKQTPNPLFNRLLQEALCSPDAEIQAFAGRLWEAKIFVVPEALQQRFKIVFAQYPKYSIQRREQLLQLALDQGEFWAFGFVLKILIYDASLEIRSESYQALLMLLSQYPPDQLKQSLSSYCFTEDHFWLDFVQGQFLLRSGSLAAAVPSLESVFQKVSIKLKQQEEKSVSLDPTELELFEETGRILTILAILEKRFSSAESYCTHPHLRLANTLLLEIFTAQISEPTFDSEMFLKHFLKNVSDGTEFEKLVCILFYFSQDSFFVQSLQEALRKKIFNEHLESLRRFTSEDLLKFWIPRLALKPSGVAILKQCFLPFARDEILAMAIAYIGYQRNPEDVPRLAPFLHHPNKTVQRFTISALGAIGTKAAQQQLRLLLKNIPFPDLLDSLLENLTPEESDEFIAEIKPFLEHEDETIRVQAVRLLPLREVESFAQDPSEQIRWQVLQKLAQTRDIKNYSSVFAYVYDESDLLMEGALEQLLEWNEVRSLFISDLKTILSQGVEDFRKCYLSHALVLLGEEHYLNDLFSDLQHSEDQIRLLALDFVAPWLLQDQNFQKLEPCLQDRNSEIRSKAVAVLKGISDPYVDQWMKRLLFDVHHSVQFQVLQNLEFLERPEFNEFIEFGYRDLLEEYPDHTLYTLSWAEWLWKQKKSVLVQIQAEYLKRWSPEELDVHSFLLKIYYQIGKTADRDHAALWIERYYQEQLLKKTEETALLKNNWAWALAEAGYDLDKALILVNSALQFSQESYILDTKAEILTQQNQKKAAKQLLQKALQGAEDLPMKIYLQRKLQKLESESD